MRTNYFLVFIFVVFLSEMPKHSKKRNHSPSSSSSEDTSSDENGSGSGSGSHVGSEESDSCRISGDRSGEDSDGDAKDQFLLKSKIFLVNSLFVSFFSF